MKRLLLAALALLVLALAGARWEALLLAALAPSGRFDARALPAPPQYGDLAAWTAHPALADESDAVPPGLAAVDPRLAGADAFYVHPTTYLGSGWNGPVGDPALNRDTDLLATRIQASAFNACCAVYGPRYRQAQGQAFVQPSPDADAAIALAYDDVRGAFRRFAAQGGGRPFVLAGHSQGAVLAARLLAEEIAPAALLRARLVAAYLVGAPIAARAPAVPPCTAPAATGCLVSWNARGPGFPGSVFDFASREERLCVNPLTWRSDDAPAEAALNEGAVFLDAGDGAPRPGFADARCRAGVLVTRLAGAPPRSLRSRALDFVIGPENHHPIEYQLFWMNLRRNAELRVAAWVQAQAAR